MLPVLEDSILARRTAEGTFGLTDLLLASTVCGTGLDTVPLPGDVSEEALAALIGEVATLAFQLEKPLTARLLPVPGKRAGERRATTSPTSRTVECCPYNRLMQQSSSSYRRPKSVIEWKRTPGKYVAILEPLEQFEARSIRELRAKGPETILVGTLRGTDGDEWYAIAYDRNLLEFDEARILARQALDRWRNGERHLAARRPSGPGL